MIDTENRAARVHKISGKVMDITEADRFALDPAFVANFKGKQPEWGPVGEITYRRTYSRRLPDGTNEEFWQTVQRVVNGTYTVQKWHCRRNQLPWSDSKAQRSAQEMFQLIWDFKFSPPGRGLWMMGTDYVEKHGSAALQNCGFVSTVNIDLDFSEPFCFMMDFMMLGVGVGSDTRGAGKVLIKEPVIGEDIHVVEDTREGWVEITGRILDAYVGRDSLPKHIDYSKVRPAGASISGFGGVASGPEPLIKLIQSIGRILGSRIGKTITSEDIVDLFDLIGVTVVSGNVRRSAIIMFGEPDDHGFLNLKNPDLPASKEAMMTHRWASNNSVFSYRGMDYTAPAAITAKSGEPGYLWLKNAQSYGRMGDAPDYADLKTAGTNPCGEQILEDHELCNLVETYPSRHESYEDYQRTLKFAYLYAKTVTLIPTHNSKTNSVMMRNRRIGLSQSGIVQSFKKHGRRTHLDWCDKGYKYVTGLDNQYSNWLCVPRSVRRTTVKPSGTVSLLCGVTPGIHYEHSEYYYRTMRVAANNPLVEQHRRAGYRVEVDKYDQSGKTRVIYFPIEAQLFDRGKTEVSLWEQLENAAQMQALWSDNSVSITVSFSNAEARDIPRALELYETRLKTVSFLPHEHEYEQAPYITISKEEYERATAALRPITYGDVSHEETEKYCNNDTCVVNPKK